MSWPLRRHAVALLILRTRPAIVSLQTNGPDRMVIARHREVTCALTRMLEERGPTACGMRTTRLDPTMFQALKWKFL